MPAKLEVHVYERPKYACRYCKNSVVSLRPLAAARVYFPNLVLGDSFLMISCPGVGRAGKGLCGSS